VPDSLDLTKSKLKLAERYQNENKLNHAEALLRDVLRQHPDHPEALEKLALTFQSAGNNAASIE